MADVNIAYMIIGCALVTFIPRLIPAVFVDKLNFGPGFEKFLNLIPFTALAALICPGVLTVDPNIWYIGLAGAIVAAALAWKKVPLGAIVIITVIALSFKSLIFMYSFHIIPYIHSFHTFSSESSPWEFLLFLFYLSRLIL